MIYFIFLAPDNGVVIKREVPKNMYVAMGIGATLCVLYGVYPELLYRYLPFTMEPYHPFTVDHITQSIEMLGMAMLPFMMYLPKWRRIQLYHWIRTGFTGSLLRAS